MTVILRLRSVATIDNLMTNTLMTNDLFLITESQQNINLKKRAMKNTYDDLNFNLDFANFNPEEIEVDETINAVFIIDTSFSVETYINELNQAFNEFTETMQKSHIAEKLFVSVIEFHDKINITSGFRPVESIPTMDFSKRIGGATALYDATLTGLKNAIDYRENLENSGVETKINTIATKPSLSV